MDSEQTFAKKLIDTNVSQNEKGKSITLNWPLGGAAFSTLTSRRGGGGVFSVCVHLTFPQKHTPRV